MERENKEVVQDDLESAASPLRVKNQVGKLSDSVDHGARTWYQRAKGTTYSALIGMKTLASNSPDQNIHERIEANENETFGAVEETKVRRRTGLKRPSRKAEKLTKTVGSEMTKQRVENT